MIPGNHKHKKHKQTKTWWFIEHEIKIIQIGKWKKVEQMEHSLYPTFVRLLH